MKLNSRETITWEQFEKIALDFCNNYPNWYYEELEDNWFDFRLVYLAMQDE